jgi:hypothetical protein
MTHETRPNERDESTAPGSGAPETNFGENGVGTDDPGFVGMDRGITPDSNSDAAYERSSRDSLIGGAVPHGNAGGYAGDAQEGLGEGRSGAAPDGNPFDQTQDREPGEESPRVQEKTG